MNADQAPVSTDKRYWTQFLGQDTAFYIGAEQIARATRLPILYVAVRRIRRGYYEVELRPLWDGRESTETQCGDRALRARLRNRRAREPRRLALVLPPLATEKALVRRRMTARPRACGENRRAATPSGRGCR